MPVGHCAAVGLDFDEAFTYAALRKAETIGRSVGSPEWLEDMAAITGQALLPGKRDPKPKAIQGFAHLSPYSLLAKSLRYSRKLQNIGPKLRQLRRHRVTKKASGILLSRHERDRPDNVF